MSDHCDPRLITRLRTFTSAAGIIPGLIGLSVLAGWTFHVVALLAWGAGTPMAPNAAGCVVLASASLWLRSREDSQPFEVAKRLAAKTAAGIITLVGLLSLTEHLFDLNFGIDRLLLVTPLSSQTLASRVLMSPVAAGVFLLLGLALLGIDWQTRGKDWPAQFLAIVAMAGAAFGLMGLILGPNTSPVTLALPAVVSYFLLAFGILCSRPTWAVGGLLFSRSQGAGLVRNAVPAALLTLSLVGLSISRALLTEAHFTWVEVSVLGVFCSALLAGFIVWIAFLVERGNAERKKIEGASHISKEQLDHLLNRIEEPQEEKLLRRKVSVGFAVAVLLTVLLSALSWRASRQAAGDADWVAHTHQVSANLEFTLRHLDDVETGERGFALTGRESFLEPYEAGKIAVGQDVQALRHLTADNPDQQRRLNLLVQQASAMIEASSDLVRYRQSSGTIHTISQLEQDKQLMDAVRGTVEKMEAEENRLLEERIQRSRAAQRLNSFAIGLGLIVGVIFLSLAGTTVSREIGVSAIARAQVNALNANLERRVEQRTASLQSEVVARAATDAKLRASEEMFRTLLDGVKDYAVYMLDLEGRVMSWNSGAVRIKGYHAEEIVGEGFSCFYTDTDRILRLPQESLKTAAQTGRFEGEGWRVRKDGSKFWADAVITPLYEANGVLRGYSKVVRDITERKRTEDELKKQATLLDLAHDAILVRDLESRVVFWNRGAQNIYGWSAAEALGKVTHDFLQTKFPEPLATIEATLASKGDWEGELRHMTSHGTEVIVASRWSLQRDERGSPAAILEINRDITDRKQAEAALSDSEGRLAGIIASAMDSIITVDDQQRVVLFNGAAEKMFRCPVEEAMGQPITRFIPERFHASHAGHIRKFGETGVTNRVMGPKDVLWAVRADGQEFQIEASISHVVTGGKKLFTVILRDVTERKQSEEIRERLAAVVESSDDAIISKDLNGTINAWNHGAEKVFGYSAAEALGKPMVMLFPPDRVREESDILARIRQGESVEHFETERLRKDGTKIVVSMTISPIRDGTGAIVGASKIARDITDRAVKEEALRESEARFRLFIEHAPAALAMFDRDMRYLHESRRWRADFGLGDREIRGVSHYEIFPEIPDRWKEIHRRALAGEVLRSENDRFERPDGKMQWIRWEVRPWQDRTGGIGGIVVLSEDVTERNRSQGALRDSEEKLRLALEGARLGSWHWELGTDELEGSPLFFALLGLPPDAKFTFARFLSTLHPDDRIRVDEAVRSCLARKSAYDIEYRAIWPDGTERWIAAKGRLYENAAGENTHMGGILFDVTERHRAEEALHESEERFQAMANGIPQLAWMAEADGHIFWYNQRWYEYTGTSPEEMQGWGWQSVHDPAELPKVLEGWKCSIANGSAFEMEFPLRAADKHFGMFLTRVMPLKDSDGRVVRWFGTNTDISERKRAEERLAELARELSHRVEELARSREALEAQTAMFKLVLASMGEGLIAADQEGHFLIFNDAAHALMGRGPEDVPKERWTQHYEVFLPDGITPYPADRLPLVLALRGESVQVELIVEQPEMLPGRSLEVTARPLRDARGNLCGGVAVLHDITERKRNEWELMRQAEELLCSQQALESQKLILQSVLDSIDEGLVAADEHGKFILWNPAAERIVGLGSAQLSPDEWGAHYHTYLPDKVTIFPPEQNPLLRAIRGEVSSVEMFLHNPELDRTVWIESNGAPLKDANGVVRGGVVAFRDITQRKSDELEIRKLNEKLEEKIVERTAQLEAANHELQAFSYSVSHDLRAPLRHIGSFAKILSQDFGSAMEPEARRHLQRIENGARHMTLLVDGLLSLARLGPQSLRLSFTELNAIVDGAISVLQPECEGRDVEWRIAQLPALECDPILMGQVFQNLLSNALKYSSRRPKSVIEVGSILQAGKQPVIFVRDNGAGFSMQYADKLFGVFQRLHTKAEFEGTGVGLATVLRIIQKHRGSIRAESEPDHGATFYFTVGAKELAKTTRKVNANGTLEQVHE